MATNPNATENTFSAKPFISKDGLDSDGVRAEVKVVVGYGDVVSLTDSSSGKTKKIEFQVSNTKYNPSGWSRDKKILELIEQAKDDNVPLHFRIETRRKGDIDRSTPIDELSDLAKAKDSIVKSIAAVKLEDDADWTISADAVTRLDEDPRSGNGIVSAYDNTAEELNPNKGSSNNNSSNSSGGYSNREPAPYMARLNTGEVNPGTAALLAPLGFFNYLLEYERDEGVQIEKERRKELAHTLMLIANKLQADIYTRKLGKEVKSGVDLTAGSHTRARALIFETMRSFAPITDEMLESEELYKKWQKAIYSISYSMWEWAIDEVEPYL